LTNAAIECANAEAAIECARQLSLSPFDVGAVARD